MSSSSSSSSSKDRPLSGAEAAVLIFKCVVVVPAVYAPLLWAGGWIAATQRSSSNNNNNNNITRPWFGFWFLLGVLQVCYLLCLLLLWDKPRIIRERSSKKWAAASDPQQEKGFFRLFLGLGLSAVVIMGWEGALYQETYPRFWNYTGAVLLVTGYMGVIAVMRANAFASAVVYKQKGQRLVTTGPYRVVRHPMYAAFVPVFAGLSLTAGSFWGLVPFGVAVMAIGKRTYHEEEFLIREFGQEYTDYRGNVKYRMIPYIF